jgi:ferredoxin-NADP reductase
MAMLDEWAKGGAAYDVAWLFWQVRTEADLVYANDVQALAARHGSFRFELLVSRPAFGEGKRLRADLIQERLGSLENADFYLCAGASLLDGMLSQLREAGVAAERLQFERFGIPVPSDSGSWALTFNGKPVPFNGHASVLDAIEHAGVRMPSDCRAGHCGECRLRVVTGQFKHLVEPGVQLGAGELLACCAVPESDLILTS